MARLNGDPARRRRQRARMLAEQNGLCVWCGFEMIGDATHGMPPIFYPTFEHMKPVASGGSGRKENLRLSCWLCNQLYGVVTLVAQRSNPAERPTPPQEQR